MVKTKLLISFYCFITILLFLFALIGNDIFNFNIIFGSAAYSFVFFEHTDSFLNNTIKVNLKEDIEDTGFLRNELNHKNLKIRKYYRNKLNYSEYFGAYLINLLFPLFIIILPLQKTKFGEACYDLFFDNSIIEWLFNIKAKKIIDKKEVIENHKNYTVETYLDGKVVYTYKGKIHREKGAASFYPKEYFYFSNYQKKYYIHGKQCSENDLEKLKLQYNCQEF